MKGETQLDSAVFQLTPTRTRCELVISAGGKTEKLASGLLKPFLTHLKTAEEQIAKGGYSIRLEPPSGPDQHVSWFTKGTIERFVRFVSTPEVLERVNTTETEIIQIEEAISFQCSDALAEEQPSKSSYAEQKEAGRPNVDENSEGAIVPFKSRRQSIDGIEPAHGENSKACLLRVLETRKMVLQKEQGMAFARAAAAGFDMDHMHDLVSFADCFGAFRLREACVNFMGLWKKKQEAGIWLEELELETMEASSTRSEMGLINASGITLNSDSVRRLRPKDFSDAWSDVPSEVGDLKVSSLDGISNLGKPNGVEAINGENACTSHNGENRLSIDGLVSPGQVGSNDYPQGHFQQPMMPVWQGQAPQHMHTFQSHGVGQGHTMQGLHGFPIQGVPYYQNYPPNLPFYQGIYPQGDEHPGLAMPSPHLLSHWPRYAEDARFGTAQRAEPHSNISANMKRSAMDERDGNVKSETSETGSSKSLSRSPDLAEPEIQSELEKEDILGQGSRRQLQRRSTSPHRRSPSPRRKVQIGRSGNKRSGMVVIRNINYITSKRHDRTGKEDITEESNSEVDSDVEDDFKKKAEDVHLRVQDVIGLFEKKTKETEGSSKKKGQHRHSAESWSVGDNEGKSAENDLSTDAGVRDVDSESWSIFQKFLLRDDEASQNNLENDRNGEACAVEQAIHQKAVMEEDMIVVDRGNQGSKDWSTAAVPLEQELGSQKKECGMEKDSLVLPERHRGDVLLNSLPFAESEETSIHKKSRTYDDFIISSEAGQMALHGADSDPFVGDEAEHMINQRSGYIHLEKSNGRSLGDDSFMVSTSMVQDQTSNEWRTVMNIDSEIPSTEQAETSSNGVRKNQLAVTDSYEPAELYMLPERNSERDSLGALWDPALDYEMQANMADKVHSNAHLNDLGDESKSSKVKLDAKAKEHPITKKSEKEARLKAMQEALEKRKAEMAARNAKLAKSSPLAEAQIRAEKLRAFKAGLQKTKKEMEEEERKRLEELKIQRQKRIAARRSLSPTSSSSTSRSVKQHQAKPGQASKLLPPNSQKGRMSRNLSPGGSFSGTRSISMPTSEVTNGLRSHKQKTSNHTKSAENVLSRSVPSLTELKKEVDETFNVSKRSSTARMSSDHVGSSKTRKEGGSPKPNGAISNSAACSSDNSDTKKRHLPATRKSVTVVSQSKDKPSKISLDSDTSVQKAAKNTSVHALQRGKGSNLGTGVGNVKSKKNTLVDASKKHNDEVILPESDEPNNLKALKTAVSVGKKEPENATISDNESGKKLGVGPGYIPSHASDSMNARDVAAQNPVDSLSDSCNLREYEAIPIRVPVKSAEEYEIDKVSESAAVPFAMHGSPNSAESNTPEDVLQPSSSMVQISESDEPYHAPLARLTSFDDPSYNKSSTYNAPLAPEISSGLQGVFIPRAPISESDSLNADTSDFPNSSPLLQNMPKLPESISPAAESGKLDTFYSRQKGSSVEKTKESAKGFKRLLKFGRKSHNSSTTADNYEDADRLREAEGRIPEDQGGNLDVTKDVGDANSHLSRITSGAIPGANQEHSLGSLISQDDDNSGVNTHKASRSFFSLSTFRSKGSETKSR